MVLPFQLSPGVSQGVLADPELAHALRTRGEGVKWVFPPEMDEILERSPGVPTQIRGLPVHIFLQAEVDRVGDPLFGQLLRLGGLTGADVALIPVELKHGEGGGYLMSAALIVIRTWARELVRGNRRRCRRCTRPGYPGVGGRDAGAGPSPNRMNEKGSSQV